MSLLNDASLVMIPSGYKDGTLYSAKPTNGDGDFTFSRGSNLAATRVNSEGLIQKGRENLLLQSNSFNTSPYAPAFATVTSGFEGYDGSNDAWKAASTTIGSETRIRQGVTFTTGEVITISVYMKKGNVNFGIVRTYAISGGGRAWFDLENGTVGTENSGINGSIQDVGNGWYRCSIWGVIDTTGAVDIAPAPSDGDYLADAVGEFIYIQDSQLESGLVATDYIETTTTSSQAGILEDMPRLDYSGGASCPSLLLEPQRSNVLPHSEYFDSSDWTKLGAGTGDTAIVTTNYAISPEGLQNATRLQCDLNGGGTSSSNQSLIYDVYSGSGSQTLSIYAKSNTGENQTIYLANTQTTGDTITVTPEWQRFTFTHSSSPYVFAIGLRGRTGGAINDTADILIYGAMAESSASYQSSYIPTYGASVTRGGDSCSKTGISSLIGQTEGTMFVEFYHNITNTTEDTRFILSDNTYNNWIFFSIENGTSLRYYLTSGGVNEIDTTVTNVFPTSQKYKVALAYEDDLLTIYVNGVQIVNNTNSTNIPAMSAFLLSGKEAVTSAVELVNKEINEAILFPTRLSNDELATLTTL